MQCDAPKCHRLSLSGRRACPPHPVGTRTDGLVTSGGRSHGCVGKLTYAAIFMPNRYRIAVCHELSSIIVSVVTGPSGTRPGSARIAEVRLVLDRKRVPPCCQLRCAQIRR